MRLSWPYSTRSRRGQIALPLIEVDFSEANGQFQKDLPNLTSLEVPHRLADAILRDSVLADGTRFLKIGLCGALAAERSNVWDANAIYELCPTALVFGMWGSPEKPGGLGAKFERAYISEIVAVDALVVEERAVLNRSGQLQQQGSAGTHAGGIAGRE